MYELVHIKGGKLEPFFDPEAVLNGKKGAKRFRLRDTDRTELRKKAKKLFNKLVLGPTPHKKGLLVIRTVIEGR